MMKLEDCLKKIKEDLAGMMGTFPNPAIALVTNKKEKKAEHKVAEVEGGTEERSK